MVIQVSFFTFLFACVYVFVTISEGYVSKHEKGLLKDMYFPPFIWSHCSSSVKNISFFFFFAFFLLGLSLWEECVMYCQEFLFQISSGFEILSGRI